MNEANTSVNLKKFFSVNLNFNEIIEAEKMVSGMCFSFIFFLQ